MTDTRGPVDIGMPWYVWRRLWLAAAVVAAIVVAIVLILEPPGAPALSTLQVTSGAEVVGNAVDGFQIQDDIHHDQYRYLLIAGRPGESDSSLLFSEIATLRHGGWGPPQILGQSGTPITEALSHPEDEVGLHQSRGDLNTIADVVKTRWLQGGDIWISPLSTTKAEGLLADRRPVLFITVARASVLE